MFFMFYVLIGLFLFLFFSFIAFISEVNMSYSQSHYMDDEYEKLFRRMNPPRYYFFFFSFYHLTKIDYIDTKFE